MNSQGRAKWQNVFCLIAHHLMKLFSTFKFSANFIESSFCDAVSIIQQQECYDLVVGP